MNKISRLERMRFSILTDDLTKCYLCGKPKEHLHEVFFGRNRINSMKWGCVVPLCFECHQGKNGVHHNHEVDIKLKQICQKKFIETYKETNFLEIFHKNYI